MEASSTLAMPIEQLAKALLLLSESNLQFNIPAQLNLYTELKIEAMDAQTKSKLIQFSGILLAILSAPMIIFQLQQGDPVEALRSLGLFSGSVAFAIGPQAFVAKPDEPKTSLAALTLAQKGLFCVAIAFLFLPFAVMYITTLLEIL